MKKFSKGTVSKPSSSRHAVLKTFWNQDVYKKVKPQSEISGGALLKYDGHSGKQISFKLAYSGVQPPSATDITAPFESQKGKKAKLKRHRWRS